MYPAGTNFPPNLYDGHLFGKESFYEELGKAQKSEMDKREKVGELRFKWIGHNSNIQVGNWLTFLFKALEAKKKLGESAKSQNAAHRKSKWDIQGVGDLTNAPLVVRNESFWMMSQIIQSSLQMSRATSGTAGSAGTVISAFGSLNKKK